jgi:general stress protein 26
MDVLSQDVINFLEKQGFVIVSTLDSNGAIHCSAKGIAGIEKKGKVFLIDVYDGITVHNLVKRPTVSITAIDEHLFMGYTLKGVATIVDREKIKDHLIKSWEDRIVRRISQRLIKHVKDEKKTPHHPEAKFPHVQHLIEIAVEEVIDLTPHHLKPTLQ